MQSETLSDEADSRQEMISTNERQAEFYETHGDDLNHSDTSLPSRVWGWARGRMKDYRRATGIKEAIRSFQANALGDLTGKRVLDLGCYDGNSMSIHLAESSESYLGVDLSTKAIDRLNGKLDGIPNAKAVAVDFLSSDFAPEPFDVVYANSVMHHFEHFDSFLSVLRSHIKPGGYVVSFDPLETAFSIRFLRWAYRPFQRDADWEWPFQRATFAMIQKHFEIESIQGFLGRSKYPIFLTPIPGTVGLATKIGIKAANYDSTHANALNRDLWRCMQVAMKLRRPN